MVRERDGTQLALRVSGKRAREQASGNGVGIDRDDPARLADQARHEIAVPADIGSDVDRYVALLKHPPHQRGLASLFPDPPLEEIRHAHDLTEVQEEDPPVCHLDRQFLQRRHHASQEHDESAKAPADEQALV